MDSAEGAATAANAGGRDWRAHLQPEARARIVNRIMETLKKHMPVSVPEGLNELRKMAVRFEEKIYTAAISQSDYLQKISLKMVYMDSQSKTNTQQNHQNAQVVQDQRPRYQASNVFPWVTSPAFSPRPSIAHPPLAGQSQRKYPLESRSEPCNKTSRECNEQSTGQQAMDSADGADPAPAAANAGGHDWRAHLQLEARARITNRILEMLKKHQPVLVLEAEGLSELQNIAVRFEEKIYAAAISQSDYLRKISLKMLFMDSRSKINARQNPQNAQVVQNQRPCHIDAASRRSASHTVYPRAGDLKEGLCQLNNTLKDQYLEGLGDLYKISMMLHGDNHMITQKATNLHEEANFKSILERSLHSVQIDKRPSLEESIPMYKRQIINILNSEEWIPEQTFQQAAGQPPWASSIGIRPAHGILSPERSNVKRLRPSQNDAIL